MARISIGSASDVRMREDNEDSLLAVVSQDSSTRAGYSGTSITSSGLLILADGMGGRAHGKIASETATVTIYRELAHILALRRRVDIDYLCASVTKAITKANARINELVAVKPDAGGMGTTVAVALVVRDYVCVGHVGDSRAYFLSGDDSTLHPLTEDHSLVMDEVRAGRLTHEQARRSKNRNVITRAVGVDTTVDVDILTLQIQSGMVAQLLVSSDGMHGSVTEQEIVRVLRENASDPQDAAEALVATARNNGARDNISAIVASIDARFGSESYGVVGLDGIHHPLDSDPDFKGLSSKLPWLTSANILAFAIGMVIMGAIAWRFFPSELIPKSTGSLAAPIVQNDVPQANLSQTAPTHDISTADYKAPIVLTYHSVMPNVLVYELGLPVTVVDSSTHQLLQIDQHSGKVMSSMPDNIGLSQLASQSGAGWAYDEMSNIYVLIQSPPSIKKYTPDHHLIRSIGVGMLTKPTEIAVVDNGDILVIDDGKLKQIQAIYPAESVAPKPASN